MLAFGSGSVLAASFSTADTNGNGKISKDEYYGYVGDLGVYGTWDLNDDDLLDENEWSEPGYDYDYTSWDLNADGYLDDNELYDGTYSYFDMNDDNLLDTNEWDDAGDDGWLDI